MDLHADARAVGLGAPAAPQIGIPGGFVALNLGAGTRSPIDPLASEVFMLPSSRLFPALCLLLLSAVACSQSRLPDPSYARPCPSPEGCVTFRVYSAGAADQPHGTPVLLLSPSGISTLGATDDDGVFLLPKAELAAPGLSALLFCWDGQSLACTAVRLDSHAVSSYDWLNVSLPANPLLRRSQALPSPQATPPPTP